MASDETFTINPCPVCHGSHTYNLADLETGGVVVTKAYEGERRPKLTRSGPLTILLVCPAKGTTYQVTLELPGAGPDEGDVELRRLERKK